MKQTTKEEAIKEAYGEYYESTKHRIDENGFDINVHKNCQTVLKEGLSVDFMVYKDKIRPRCLQGIENNNGWTKIESEKDLPQDTHHVYMVARDKEILFKSGLTEITVGYLYATGKITHYQQIQEFKPPIF